jgi:hypothetical protein
MGQTPVSAIAVPEEKQSLAWSVGWVVFLLLSVLAPEAPALVQGLETTSRPALGLLVQQVGETVQIKTLSGELTVDSVDDDLLLLVGEGNLLEDEAAQIRKDLTVESETTYILPRSTEELRTALGFLPEAEIGFAELPTFLAVHAQMSLGVSPATAAYLVRAVPLEAYIELPSARARPIQIEAHADSLAL